MNLDEQKAGEEVERNTGEKTPHILVVDDEKSICDILLQFLGKAGYQATATRNGEEAIGVLEGTDVDMVLTDIKMPGISGVEVLKWVKGNKPSVPVLLTTGFPTLDTAIEALKLGAFDYLTKPFHLEEIGEKIKRALDGKHLREENALFASLVSLHEVTKVFTSTHDPNELHRKVLDYCARLSKSDGGALMFLDSNHRLAVFEALGEEYRREVFEEDFFRAASGRTIVQGKPLTVFPGENGSDNGLPDLPPSVGSYVSFPLKTSQRTIGVLNLVRRAGSRPFSDLDLQTITVLASHAGVSIENVRLYQNIRDNYLKTVRGFALAVEIKDRYTHGHSENVMKYAVVLARKLGLSMAEIEKVKYAGLLHDVGKIGVSELILNKPGKLSLEEFEEIKKHPGLGARILSDVPFLKPLVSMILHHHEYYDGSGYPEGLSGESIPHGARILGVCDAFEAMTSHRPYRKAMTSERAMSILDENKGRQFDPAIAETFLQLLRSEPGR